ncbi:MAG: NAD(P)-dependent oxidoreductase [bacterium]|nr:NAD(P)-dependent oxidoreductase [bacterium]
MNVLVTGATGFFGSRIVRILLADGHDVTILKRSFSDTRRIVDVLSQVSAFDIDLCESSAPFEGKRIDALLHAGTCYGRKGESASVLLDANVLFPVRLMENAACSGVKAFFNMDTFLPADLNGYALSKRQFRDWGRRIGKTLGIRFVNIRVDQFYGAEDDDTKFPLMVILKCLENVPELPLTEGIQKRDFIHVDDVAEAFLLLLRKRTGEGAGLQEYDVGTGQPIRVREFVETAHRLAGSRTHLSFGAVPYRENEPMDLSQNTAPLAALGWKCRIGLEAGIRSVIDSRKERAR